MASNLKGKRVAILATDGFEQAELLEPRKALDEAGARTEIVAPKEGQIKGWDHTDWGKSADVDKTLDDANPHDYDALVLPGGVMNPDRLRTDPRAINFIRQFIATGKPVAAICHGPWTLIEADAVRGKTMTSWPSLKTDLKNAGANWVDQQVATDSQFITSRKPDDIPAFNQALIAAIEKGGAHRAAA